ncbi:MAG: cytidine deaminase [Lentisphaerae bacterium]|nr:cytidine deaminase [Lentisphaerota bacterium]
MEKLGELICVARKAARNSYSPYSSYPVGAAMLTSDGKIFTGCNVENASYGLTNCAERTAVFKAVSEGKRKFIALAIVGGSAENPATPCGACRQVLTEFCSPDMPVICSGLEGDKTLEFTVGELLPHSFLFEKYQ